MRNPYLQVALTYVHRVRSWARLGYLIAGGIAVAFVFFVMIIGALEDGPGGDHYQEFVWWYLMPFGFLFVLLVVHVREQFANLRARLTPDFCRIHIAIASVAAVLCAVLLPAAFAWPIGWHPVGFAAITLLLFAAVFWAVLSPSTSHALWIGWLLLLTELGKGCVQQLVSGNFEYQAVGILAVGVVIALLGGIRLIRLNEEMPEYRLWNRDLASRRVVVIGSQVTRHSILLRLIFGDEDKRMANLTRHARRASVSRWSRVCRWQVGMLTGWPVIGFGLMFFLSFTVMTWIMSRGTPPLIAISAFFASFMPACMAWGVLWQRRKLLPRESLMCVDRASYLKQVGMAAALSQFQMWLGMTAVLALVFFGVARQPLSVAVASVLTISALSQLWFFGLGVWLLRFRSPILYLLGWIASFHALIVAMIGTELAPTAIFQRSVVLIVVAIFAVLGLILTWDAYRRWLVADID